MLEVGKERAEKRGLTGLRWKVENAETLSFGDASFDAYTIVFGIRNVTDIPAALREAHRVLKRGGRFYCMEFSTSDWPGFSNFTTDGRTTMIPRIGKAVADDEESYRYLVESIRRFPEARGVPADDRRRRLRPRRGRADARRARHHPQRWKISTCASRHPPLADPQMGADARPPRRAHRDRARIR